MCTAPTRCYVRRMWVKRPVLDTALDAGFAVAGFGLTAVATWTSTSLTGTPLTGPRWLLAVLPLLIGGPLLLRRRAPLLMWVIVWAGISLQALATHLPPRGPELVFVLCAGSYALAAHDTLARAIAGRVIAVPGLTISTPAPHKRARGMVTPRPRRGGKV